MMWESLSNQKLERVVRVTPFFGIPCLVSFIDSEHCLAYIVHDDIESRDSVGSNKQQFVCILLFWKRVDIPDFASGK
jgi:hypothetical protein